MQRRRREWALEGECSKPENMTAFINYVEDNRTAKKEQYREEFRKICARCPVQRECLDYAIVHEAAGFWGGTTAKERKTMRSQALDRLAYQAAKEGWLEPHNLLTEDVAQEIQELAAFVAQGLPIPLSQQELDQARAVLEGAELLLDFSLFPDYQETAEPNSPSN